MEKDEIYQEHIRENFCQPELIKVNYEDYVEEKDELEKLKKSFSAIKELAEELNDEIESLETELNKKF